MKSLIDVLEFACHAWEDPEWIGLKGYVLYSKKTDEELKPMLKITKFDPSAPSVIRLGVGTFSFVAEITDIWGAKALYKIADDIKTDLPTNEERIEFAESGTKEKLMVTIAKRCYSHIVFIL